jgi:hypothetical protein
MGKFPKGFFEVINKGCFGQTSSRFDLDIRRNEPGKAILIFKKLPDKPRPVKEKKTDSDFKMPEDADFKMLVAMIPPAMRTHKTILEMVLSSFRAQGFRYVARNIQYTNMNAKKNYRSYLSKALKLDYGLAVEEDEAARGFIDAENKKRVVEREKQSQAEKMKIQAEQEKASRAKVYLSSLSPEALAAIQEEAFNNLDEGSKNLVTRKSATAEIIMKIAMNRIAIERMKVS